MRELWLRAGAGALLGVLLATMAWIVGLEQHGLLASLGMVGLVAGPAFLALGIALTLWMEGPRTMTWTRRLITMLLGMAGSVATLLAVVLLFTLLIGPYAVLFAAALLIPTLAGGLGVGLGCQIGCPCPRRDA